MLAAPETNRSFVRYCGIRCGACKARFVFPTRFYDGCRIPIVVPIRERPIKMAVFTGIDVEIHLAAETGPPDQQAHFGHRFQHVVDRSQRHLPPGASQLLVDPVGGSVSQPAHNRIHPHPLRGGLKPTLVDPSPDVIRGNLSGYFLHHDTKVWIIVLICKHGQSKKTLSLYHEKDPVPPSRELPAGGL